jgi:hypothetical protein
MKKLVATLCIAGSVFALSACDSTGSGNVETAVPYSQSRTASNEPAQAAPLGERVFKGGGSHSGLFL